MLAWLLISLASGHASATALTGPTRADVGQHAGAVRAARRVAAAGATPRSAPDGQPSPRRDAGAPSATRRSPLYVAVGHPYPRQSQQTAPMGPAHSRHPTGRDNRGRADVLRRPTRPSATANPPMTDGDGPGSSHRAWRSRIGLLETGGRNVVVGDDHGYEQELDRASLAPATTGADRRLRGSQQHAHTVESGRALWLARHCRQDAPPVRRPGRESRSRRPPGNSTP
jgi:hypothetical protein